MVDEFFVSLGPGESLPPKLIPFLVHRMREHRLQTMSPEAYMRRLATEPWLSLLKEVEGELAGMELAELKNESIADSDVSHFLDLAEEFIESLLDLAPNLPPAPSLPRERGLKAALRGIKQWCIRAEKHGSLSEEQLRTSSARDLDVLLVRMRVEHSLTKDPVRFDSRSSASANARAQISDADEGRKRHLLDWAASLGVPISEKTREPAVEIPEGGERIAIRPDATHDHRTSRQHAEIRTFSDCAAHLITWPDLIHFLATNGIKNVPKVTRKITAAMPTPVWKARSRRPLFRFGEALAAAQRIAGDDERFAQLVPNQWLKSHLHLPDFRPHWASAAS